MSSDKLAKHLPEAAAAAEAPLLQLPLQQELGLLAVSLNGTFLSPLELLVVSCASRGWCRTVEDCSAGHGFACGPFTHALQIESQMMCELLAFDVDFDPRDFRLALLVAAESVDQVPVRVAEAVAQVRYLPNVRMPREYPAEAIEWTAIPCGRSYLPVSLAQEASFSAMRPIEDLLTRTWACAYIDGGGNCDPAIRKQAFDLLKHWRALWCCGLRTQTISAGCLHVMLPGQNQKETWDLSAVVLTFPSGVVAAAHVSYVQEEHKFLG
jgi:hypothetical protein